MTNAIIVCDLGWKVHKCHTANRKGSFNVSLKNDQLNSVESTYIGGK